MSNVGVFHVATQTSPLWKARPWEGLAVSAQESEGESSGAAVRVKVHPSKAACEILLRRRCGSSWKFAPRRDVVPAAGGRGLAFCVQICVPLSDSGAVDEASPFGGP